jgi:uncharacterized membrane protein HdeD (DUF308 family)
LKTGGRKCAPGFGRGQAEFFAPQPDWHIALGFWMMVGGTAELIIALGRRSWTRRMQTVYDFVTVICFLCVVVTYFMFTEGGMKVLAHFMLPAAAFAIANQVGNHAGSDLLMNILAVVLIVAGIGYTFIIVRHSPA